MTFKTVEWVRRVRDVHHEQTRGMSFEQRVAFYRSKSEALARRLTPLRRKLRERRTPR